MTNGFHGLLRPETADTSHTVLFLLQSKSLVNTVILASKSVIVTTIMQRCLARYKNHHLFSPCCSQDRRPPNTLSSTSLQGSILSFSPSLWERNSFSIQCKVSHYSKMFKASMVTSLNALGLQQGSQEGREKGEIH